MTKNTNTKSQPCPETLRLSGFTPVEIACDLEEKHKLPHVAHVRTEDGHTVKLSWRRLRDETS